MTNDNKKIAFDPWTATEEDMEDDEQIASKNVDARVRYWQWSYAQSILELKEQVEAGNGQALLECISKLLNGGLIAPQWLELAFNNCYHGVLGGQYLSWDDVFGKPHPRMIKRKRLEANRRDVKRMMRIGSFIGGQVNNNISKSKAYEMAASKFDIEPRIAFDYYERYLNFIRIDITLTERQIRIIKEANTTNK